MFDMVCIGSISQDVFFPMDNIDIINTPEDLLSQKKMVFEFGAKYGVRDRYDVPGGCSANVSQGLSRLGVHVAGYGVLGNDLLGKSIEDELQEEGVDITTIQHEKNSRTDLAFILVDSRSGERTVFYNRDANEKLQISKSVLKNAKQLFVSGLSGEWENNIKIVIDHCRENSVPLILNPGQKNIHSNPEVVIEAIKASIGLFVNKDEAIELVGHIQKKEIQQSELNNEKYLLDILAASGPGFVSITDGKRGAWLASQDRSVFAKPEIIEDVLDSTGAGDAFTSGFLAAYLKEKDLEQCVQWGITNAKSVIQHYGAKKGLLKEEEIEVLSEQIEVKEY